MRSTPRARTSGPPSVTPARQRAVVDLRYYEDLSESQTAHLLGCALGTVKSQCSKAMAKLRLDAALVPAESEGSPS